MIVHYFKARLSEKNTAAILALRRACSNSRKVFWFFKSFNHIGDMFNRICNGDVLNFDGKLVDKVDFIEQIFLVFVFF